MIRMGTVFSVEAPRSQASTNHRGSYMSYRIVTWPDSFDCAPHVLSVQLWANPKRSVSVMCCCICPWHFWSPWSAAWKPFHLSRCPSHHYVLSSPIISRTKKHIILLVVTCLIMLYLLLIVFWLRAVVHRSCNQLWRQQTSPHPHVKVCIHRMSAVFMWSSLSAVSHFPSASATDSHRKASRIPGSTKRYIHTFTFGELYGSTLWMDQRHPDDQM